MFNSIISDVSDYVEVSVQTEPINNDLQKKVEVELVNNECQTDLQSNEKVTPVPEQVMQENAFLKQQVEHLNKYVSEKEDIIEKLYREIDSLK